MGSWGRWNKRKRHLRRVLSAIDAPDEVMWAAYAPSYSLPWDGEELRGHIRSLYEGMKAAVVQEGLTDEGIFGGKDMPDQVVWGKEAQARIAEHAERPDTERHAHWWPWGNLVWANSDRSTTVLVNSDWDAQIPWHVLAWGDHAEACIAALEGALETEGWWC